MVLLYHITHVNNLRGIMTAGCLWCDAERSSRAGTVTGIAHQHIKDRRARRTVVVAAGGTLADYVPFYFAPRSPMLYSIHRDKVAGYTGGQDRIVLLVSSIEVATATGKPWLFTDGHAEMAFSRQFADLQELPRIDWNLMKADFWNDTVEDNDRKRRRQAEFLVYRSFPCEALLGIGVISASIGAEVRGILGEQKLPVAVRRSWYY